MIPLDAGALDALLDAPPVAGPTGAGASGDESNR